MAVPLFVPTLLAAGKAGADYALTRLNRQHSVNPYETVAPIERQINSAKSSYANNTVQQAALQQVAGQIGRSVSQAGAQANSAALGSGDVGTIVNTGLKTQGAVSQALQPVTSQYQQNVEQQRINALNNVQQLSAQEQRLIWEIKQSNRAQEQQFNNATAQSIVNGIFNVAGSAVSALSSRASEKQNSNAAQIMTQIQSGSSTLTPQEFSSGIQQDIDAGNITPEQAAQLSSAYQNQQRYQGQVKAQQQQEAISQQRYANNLEYNQAKDAAQKQAILNYYQEQTGKSPAPWMANLSSGLIQSMVKDIKESEGRAQSEEEIKSTVLPVYDMIKSGNFSGAISGLSKVPSKYVTTLWNDIQQAQNANYQKIRDAQNRADALYKDQNKEFYSREKPLADLTNSIQSIIRDLNSLFATNQNYSGADTRVLNDFIYYMQNTDNIDINYVNSVQKWLAQYLGQTLVGSSGGGEKSSGKRIIDNFSRAIDDYNKAISRVRVVGYME